ncbi:MAG: hypothetical protein ABI867_09075 [Kofleriaceae bacterium]
MRTLVVLVLLAGCGDNSVAPERCDPPVVTPVLPTEGHLIDPLAIALPADCVEGGLADIAGRWFVVNPTELFDFGYPAFAGTCETGFARVHDQDDDYDPSGDGFTRHTWSDGTRVFTRSSFTFDLGPDGIFEFTTATAACMRPDGTLASVVAHFDSDRGETVSPQTGTRFDVKDNAASGLEQVGEVAAAGLAPIVGYNVVVDGTIAVVVGPAGMFTIDVADPTVPAVLGFFEGEFNDVRVVRGGGKIVAYLAPIRNENTQFVDITDPAHPAFAGVIPEYSHSVQVATVGAATHLYLATYTDQVPRYDVTNPLVPVRLGAATVPGEAAGVHDLTVDGDRLLVNNTTAGFVAIDVASGLAVATEVGRIPTSYSHASFAGTLTSGRRVILHGDEGMTGTSDLGAFLRIIDGDPASPAFMHELARYQSRPEVGIHNIELVGDRVYLSYYQDGIRIVDIADPTQPREVAHYNTWDPATASGDAFEGAVGVRVVDGLIYVADIARGLIILRETAP